MANQKYDAFLTVARLGSFKAAAEELGYTQAGISYLVNALEKELGLTLFLREYGGVHLTTEGREVLGLVQAINADEHALAARNLSVDSFARVTEVESINIINARHTFEHMSVLEQMQRTLEVFDTYYAYEEIVGFERIAKTLVPREAFREAIANALVHRCWDVRANIKVGMFADRIEITSPGGLPAGITEELYLAGGPSVARNPILANVFFRLGHIERFGTGIPRILDEYAHETVSPSFALRDSSITVMLPVTVLENVTLDEEAILAVLAKGSALTRSQISEKTQLSKSKAIRTLNALVEKGLVTKVGEGRSVRYERN